MKLLIDMAGMEEAVSGGTSLRAVVPPRRAGAATETWGNWPVRFS